MRKKLKTLFGKREVGVPRTVGWGAEQPTISELVRPKALKEPKRKKPY